MRQARRDDYFTHCSNHELRSAGLKHCRRKAGAKLSPSCVNTGQISSTEVKRRASQR